MHWINYNHLYYFWIVAKEGGVTAASKKLHLSPSTISSQISTLEDLAGHKLFKRVSRQMLLTEMGRKTFQTANEIFGLGIELQQMLEGRVVAKKLVIGAAMVVPKLIVHQLLPLEELLRWNVRLTSLEDSPTKLMAALAIGEIDMVISDAPVPTEAKVTAYNHLLGKSGISLFASRSLVEKYGDDCLMILKEAPLLLPTTHATMRRELEKFFNKHDIVPNIVAEFQDSALTKVYGQNGWGAFIAPTPIAEKIVRQYDVLHVGRLPFSENFYAITTDRKISDPIISHLVASSRDWFSSIA